MSSTKVPQEIIIPLLNKMIQECGRCADNFLDREFELLRFQCGTPYHGVPLEDIRRQSINLRKAGKLLRVNGHAPGKADPPSEKMLAYYECEHWKRFATSIRDFWKRCVMCGTTNPPFDVHHNTYQNLGHEDFKDVVPLCRKCHKAAEKRRRDEKNESPLFGGVADSNPSGTMSA